MVESEKNAMYSWSVHLAFILQRTSVLNKRNGYYILYLSLIKASNSVVFVGLMSNIHLKAAAVIRIYHTHIDIILTC